MTHPSDFIVQATFLNADEVQFRKARERRKRPKDPLPAIPDGPCCFRCRHWRPPGAHEELGTCGQFVVVSERVKFGPERGTVFHVDQAMTQSVWPWEFLATRGFFAGCSRYAAAEGRDAA